MLIALIATCLPEYNANLTTDLKLIIARCAVMAASRISSSVAVKFIPGLSCLAKNIFVCITGPDGKPLAAEALGSGKFSTRDGEQKLYTQKIDINYTQGQRQPVSIDWKQNTNFEKGDYKIEVYNNGFKIGEGVRSLKKGGLFS